MVNKVILELDASRQTPRGLRTVAASLKTSLHQPFTAWFKAADVGACADLIEAFLKPIADANPFLIWRIVLETGSEFPQDFIARLKTICQGKKTSIYGGVMICCIWTDAGKPPRGFVTKARGVFPVYRSLDIAPVSGWRGRIRRALAQPFFTGVLADCAPESTPVFIAEAMRCLAREARRGAKEVFLRNLALHYSGQVNQLAPGAEHTVVHRDLFMIENIISYDRNMRACRVMTADNATKFDVFCAQREFVSFLKPGERQRLMNPVMFSD